MAGGESMLKSAVRLALFMSLGLLLLGSDLRTAHLFVELPEYAVTPDGMAIAPDGDLVVACPNFASNAPGSARPSVPACLIKVDKRGKVRKWVEVPVLAETGRACPQGIAFGPKGELYVVDNQTWATGNGAQGEINQGRILRLTIENNRIADTVVVARGISHPNGIRYYKGDLYVTVSMLPKVKRPDGLMTSAVYRFPRDGREIEVANTLEDKNLLVSFVTQNRYTKYGLDGIVFDSKGNLFVGNFGDGVISKIVLDAHGRAVSNTVFARTNFNISLDPTAPGFLAQAMKSKMRTTDGICIDSHDNLYVADFSNNAIAKVTPDGEVSVLAQNSDTDGRHGELNEPGEPIVWDGRLIVANFNAVVGPDKVSSKHSTPATLSVVKLRSDRN
jgi:sugar lactone lactonase YvrE